MARRSTLLARALPRRDLRRAQSIIRRVCQIAGQFSCIDDAQDEAVETGLTAAVAKHDTPAIFDWLMGILSYQGISDAVADRYIHEHGTVCWADIHRVLAGTSRCNKLIGYWAFTDCRYEKGKQTCAEPAHFATCPLPRHVLRNGRLNQTAYSLYFSSAM